MLEMPETRISDAVAARQVEGVELGHVPELLEAIVRDVAALKQVEVGEL